MIEILLILFVGLLFLYSCAPIPKSTFESDEKEFGKSIVNMDRFPYFDPYALQKYIRDNKDKYIETSDQIVYIYNFGGQQLRITITKQKYPENWSGYMDKNKTTEIYNLIGQHYYTEMDQFNSHNGRKRFDFIINEGEEYKYQDIDWDIINKVLKK